MRVTAAGLGVLSVCCLSYSSAPAADAVPGYIQADPAVISKAYGQPLTARIFSSEFTAVRFDKLAQKLSGMPGLDCPAHPSMILSDVLPSTTGGAGTAWVERYTVACNRTVRRSLFLSLEDGKPLFVVPLMPGDTLAGPQLQYDTLQFVNMAAQPGGGKGCNYVFVADTAVVAPPTSAGTPWFERWTVMACGNSVSMDVSYTPTPADGGTDISVHAAKP